MADAKDTKAERQAWASLRERQRNWVLSGGGQQKRKASEAAAWRPTKRNRLHACRNLQYLDRQLVLAGVDGGMSQYLPDLSTHWASWPVLSISWDQESSNLAGAHFLYKLGVCTEVTWDHSHGAWNDIKQACKDCNMMTFLLSMMLVWNLPHGPSGSDLRSGQVCEMLQGLFEKSWGSVAPLFEAHSFQVLQDDGRQELLASPEDLPTMWASFVESSPFAKKGSKANLNRFMSLVREAKRESKVWTLRQISYTMVCMENDDLRHAVSGEQLQVNNLPGKSSDRSTTANKHDVVEQALRKSPANAMVLAVQLLSSEQNRRRLRVFVECCGLVDTWFSEQNRALRSSGATLEWMLRQTSGKKCMDSLGQLWAAVTLEPALARQFFWLPHPDNAAPSMECGQVASP